MKLINDHSQNFTENTQNDQQQNEQILPPLSFQDSRSVSSVMRKLQKLKVLRKGHKQDRTGTVHIHYISENYRLSIQT